MIDPRDSILDSVKKVIGFNSDYTAFDIDIIMHINSVLSILHQLGVGPVEGFYIEDHTATWNDFLGDVINMGAVKTYVYLRVRLLFDPPTTSYLITSMKEQVQELEWRLNIHREGESWTNPNPPVDLNL